MIEATTQPAAYLTQSGATVNENLQVSFGETPKDYIALAGQTAVIPLTHLGLLAVNGAKGDQLLQGQVTCDINQLTEHTTLTGAQCTPQGRMLAYFRAFQTNNTQRLLQMPTPLVDALAQHLVKYAVFFQVSLENASADFHSFGLTGDKASHIVQQLLGTTPSDNSVVSCGGVLGCQISKQQYQILAPSQQASDTWRQLLENATPAGTGFWTLQSIQAGLGEVRPETVEQFIPQMLNLEKTGAISFKKGCYTGQEIVARTKYRGKLKKRMYRFEVATQQLPEPGTTCSLPEQDKNIGQVVSAAWKDTELAELLLVLNNDIADTDCLIFGNSPPAACKRLGLPYSESNDDSETNN